MVAEKDGLMVRVDDVLAVELLVAVAVAEGDRVVEPLAVGDRMGVTLPVCDSDIDRVGVGLRDSVYVCVTVAVFVALGDALADAEDVGVWDGVGMCDGSAPGHCAMPLIKVAKSAVAKNVPPM